ncbi:MAG: hypothetical protein Ct9H90mP27_2150 [Gammaproteobacteria bacterium]|nr:MAG: hypothetical protein Ct9H90mP27_2150 [Gammaproteobacteria bacterium]
MSVLRNVGKYERRLTRILLHKELSKLAFAPRARPVQPKTKQKQANSPIFNNLCLKIIRSYVSIVDSSISYIHSIKKNSAPQTHLSLPNHRSFTYPVKPFFLGSIIHPFNSARMGSKTASSFSLELFCSLTCPITTSKFL